MRLSTLEKRILYRLDNVLVNSYDKYLSKGLRREIEFSYWDVFVASYDEWPEDGETARARRFKARKASFSRAVHRLVEEKGLVMGLALGWVWVEKGGDNSVGRWQGGGRRKAEKWKDYVFKESRPRFKKLLLTEAGWHMVRRLKGDGVTHEDGKQS